MAQTLYYNGTILTMEDRCPQVEAVLTEDGRILETGTWEKVKERAGDKARRLDLQGRVMMPGFIDSHSHFTACASHTMEVDLGGAGSFEDMIICIRQYIEDKKIPEGKWVTASGYDHNRLKEHSHPRRKVLDQAAPQNPLILKHQSGHMGVFNTMALNLLGVTGQTQAPQGGVIEMEGGLPTGYMEENAFLGFQGRIPMPSAEDFLTAYGRAQELYASYGITTVQEGLMASQLVPLYQMLLKSGLLKLDLISFMDIRDSDAARTAFESHIKNYKGHMKIGGYKMFLDGSPQGRTAWMRTPYLPETPDAEEKAQADAFPRTRATKEDYCGYNTLEDSQVKENILKAELEDMQLLAHCNGDRAAEQYMDMLEAVYRELGSGNSRKPGFYRGDIRPVMIHAQLLGLDQLERVKKLGIIPSFFLAHVYHWGDIHVRNFGQERAGRISPAASALKEGICFTLHQDSPVIMPDMMETLWCAVNRRSRVGKVLGPEERIPVWDALKAVTVNGAYQYFEENEKGTVTPGKKADFVVLEQNPLETGADEIRNIRVLATIKEDRLLWKA